MYLKFILSINETPFLLIYIRKIETSDNLKTLPFPYDLRCTYVFLRGIKMIDNTIKKILLVN